MRSDGMFCMRPTAVQGRAELALQSREPRLAQTRSLLFGSIAARFTTSLVEHARQCRTDVDLSCSSEQNPRHRRTQDGAQNYQKRPLAQDSVLLHSTSIPLLLSPSLSYLSNLTKASW